jgi:hypothetical protein
MVEPLAELSSSVTPACIWPGSMGMPKPIGVGTVHWFAPLLPPNRAGGSPALGSPVGGFTS